MRRGFDPLDPPVEMRAFATEGRQADSPRDGRAGHCRFVVRQDVQDPLRWCRFRAVIDFFGVRKLVPDLLQLLDFGDGARKLDFKLRYIGKQQGLELVKLNVRDELPVRDIFSQPLLKAFYPLGGIAPPSAVLEAWKILRQSI